MNTLSAVEYKPQGVKQIGLVVIGRNEGERLRQCLLSVIKNVARVVYVDSGSTDDSVEIAHSLGVEVIGLDLSKPFTAARARNAGYIYLKHLEPNLKFVQFVDGDCEVVGGWLDYAQGELEANPNVAVVCGRRRERFRRKSIYNRLCDMEWDTPVGEASGCGGDAMMRTEAFEQVGGFNPTLIAGEEPELCLRLRQRGWKIFRLDAEMTWHDAQMTRFSQCWKRFLRAGHAYAEGAWLHGHTPERHWVKESRSIWFWGLLLPLLVFAIALLTHGLSLLLLLSYPLMTYRIYRHKSQSGLRSTDALLYSLSCMIGKFPQVQGQIQFHLNRLLGQRSNLVEYKTVLNSNS